MTSRTWASRRRSSRSTTRRPRRMRRSAPPSTCSRARRVSPGRYRGPMAGGRNQRQKRPSRSARHQKRHQPRKPIAELTVRLPQRTIEPETVIAHLGPTNSGKTHDALRFLVENGRGIYAAPLRMLAQEAHRRLAAEIGEDGVGLVTGEERVNPSAPIICCTAEMAPMRGETLVLDEVQWAEDEERGSAWTRLMLGGEYRHILLLGAVEALPLVQHAFAD